MSATPIRTHLPRRWLVLGLVVLLAAALAIAPFLPQSDGPDKGITSSGAVAEPVPAAAAGLGELTPEMEAEIERVVSAGQGAAPAVPRSFTVAGRAIESPPMPELDEGGAYGTGAEGLSEDSVPAGDVAKAVDSLVRCADFEGQRYCLGQGWTDSTEDEVRARVASSVDDVLAKRASAETTGDLSAEDLLARRAALTPRERARAEREELTQAARSVAKVWLLRHEIEGVDLPDGFLADHPEAVARPAAAPVVKAKPKTYGDYPQRDKVLKPAQVQEQTVSYWCGPTTMQMIAWGWTGELKSQDHWAGRLGTTRSGSSIWDMVRVVNQDTGWGGVDHAGPYIVLDISDYSYQHWRTLMMRHITDYRAPVVLHPVLLKQFYPYLDDDASGHFQVGRGYSKRGDRPDRLGFFEPWNQQRFDPSEPYIERVQWRSAYRSYRANQAHFQHNVGV